MGGNSRECIDIPAVITAQDQLGSLHTCSGELLYDAYKSLSPKVAKISTEHPDGKDDSGTGFFVLDGTHMVTSAHVVMPAAEMHVNYNGKQYEAVIEKLDDVNDLAQIKVLGLDADPSRSQKIDPNLALRGQQDLISVGVPGVHNMQQFVSTGKLIMSDKYFNILRDPAVNDPLADRIRAAYNSGDPVLSQTAQAVAESPRLVALQGARPGQSGSPIDDMNGNLVGVITATNGNNTTVDVPYTKVVDLLNRPESKFNFAYDTRTEFVLPSTNALLSNTLGVGATAAGFMGKGRMLPVAYAGVKTISLIGEVSELSNTTDASKRHDLEVNIAQDATMIAGGVAATAMWRSPIGRVAGLGVMGLSLASRFVTDSQEQHKVLTGITRKDGNPNRPWGMGN